MLDEAEFAEVSRLYGEGFHPAHKPAAHEASREKQHTLEERFAPVSRAYERLTGRAGCHPNAVMHHRLALYGPPCTACGKPLRTPEARLCAACGSPRPPSSP